MKIFYKIRQRVWQWWYKGSPVQTMVESYQKIAYVLERRVKQLERQLNIEPVDEGEEDISQEILDLFFGHGERPMQDEDFYNLFAEDVIQKAYITTETAIIKLASSHKNLLHIKICRTEQEKARIEQFDKFGFVISKSQASAFIAETFKCMKAATKISRVGFDNADPVNGILIMVPDASDLSPFVRILEENKEILTETIQWKNDIK